MNDIAYQHQLHPSQANGEVIQTLGLTKAFKDFWHRQRVVAVDRLDLDVHRGEVFGLLGPNGSGKTTTIKMLLGLLFPTRGRISIFGRPPTDVAVKARIGYLPEESYLYRFLNARETLDYYARLFKIPAIERRRRVEQLLEMVGLHHEGRRRVGEYSKGMARRIGLAQALINDPELLILDEPTAGMDPVGTREIKDLIVYLHDQKKKTILLCSHLLADVEDVCQRVIILYGGKRQAMGDIHELLAQQDQTQITTEKLSPESIQRIRQIVESEAGQRVLSVAAPTARLEAFFLDIVKKAQESQQRTSGVTSGGQIADFLASPSTGENSQLLESLVKAAESPSATATPSETSVATTVQPEPPAVDLANLLRPAPPIKTPPSPTGVPAVPPSSVDQADTSLIDDLVKRSSKPPREA